jgi:hypothetical protein
MARRVAVRGLVVLAAAAVTLLPQAASAQDGTTTVPPTTTAAPTTVAPTTTRPATTTAAPTTRPPVTTVSPTTVPATTTTAAPAADESDDSNDWLLWVIVAAIAVVAIALVAWLLANRASQRKAVAAAHTRNYQQLVGEAIWLHDQASVDLLGAGSRAPDRIRMEWDDVRRRSRELQSQSTTLALSAPPETAPSLQRLGQAVGGLTGALDTYVDLRARDDIDDTVQTAMRASAEAVDLRRRELEAATEALRAQMGSA